MTTKGCQYSENNSCFRNPTSGMFCLFFCVPRVTAAVSYINAQSVEAPWVAGATLHVAPDPPPRMKLTQP